MKKTFFIFVILLLSLVFCLPSAAAEEELPVYTWGSEPEAYGGEADALAPFGYKYIDKNSGEIEDMTFCGTNQNYSSTNPLYCPGRTSAKHQRYPYCFISATGMHPATNALPAPSFTAPHSGKVEIRYFFANYEWNGNATVELQIYKNTYSPESLLHTEPLVCWVAVQVFKITVEVEKGDVILFALDCGEDGNGEDECSFYIRRATYMSIEDDEPTEEATTAPNTSAPDTLAPDTLADETSAEETITPADTAPQPDNSNGTGLYIAGAAAILVVLFAVNDVVLILFLRKKNPTD